MITSYNSRAIIETFKERGVPRLIELSASVGWDYDGTFQF